MLKIQSHFSRTKFQPAYSVHPYQLVKKMPVLTRDHLALQFQQNWMAKHPMDTCSNGGLNLDDSLTSLNWLQNLNILKITTPTQPSSPSPLTFGDLKHFKVNPNSILNVSCGPPTTKMSDNRLSSLETPPPTPTTPGGDSIDYSVEYKANTYMKPPYSYATLICMAMKETKTAKITLSAIYSWITENFLYYRLADPSWQNSIRHNLSLNKCFQKVPRRKDEPGKGGFWRINPDYSDHIENGVFKKRRNSKDGQTGAIFITPATLPLNLKRTKCEKSDDMYEACSSGHQPMKLRRLDDSVFQISDNDENDGHLKVDFNWTSILNQDIDIGGIKVQPEDLIGSPSEKSASPIMAMSPPSSDSNSVSDFGFEDLLGDNELSPSESPLDFTTNDSLSLQIVGQTIKAPGWWADSFNAGETRGFLQNIENLASRNCPNSHVTQSLLHDDVDENLHPWFDRTVLNADAHFDVDNLFDNSSPHT